VKIEEATQNIKDEIKAIAKKDTIKIEKSIQSINSDISKRTERYQQESKNLKEIYDKDLKKLEDSEKKMKSALGGLNEMLENLESSNILNLLKMKEKHESELVKQFESPVKESVGYTFGNPEAKLNLDFGQTSEAKIFTFGTK
jgi:hypothetical protein